MEAYNMKKILTILLILLLSQVCFAGRVQQAHKAVIAAKNGAGGGSCSENCTGYDVCENFEGTGTPSGWTVSSTGTTVDFDYTTSPLRGSQSLALQGSANTTSTVYYTVVGDFTAASDHWVHFLYSYPTTPWAIGYNFFNFAGNKSIYINTSNKLVSNSTTGSATLTTNTKYHIWVHYVVDSSDNYTIDIYISESTTRPSSPDISTSGTGGYSIYRIEFTSIGNGTATYLNKYDQVYVDASEPTICD